MNDRAKALDAIRFDMAAYADTLRVYRDALDHAATRIDASSAVGEDRQARLGLLRRDARQLEREMRALRKRLRRSSPALVDVARIAGDLVGRTGQLRTRLVAEGAPPRP